MQTSGSISLGVVVLAAGKSSRMGRPKLLLPWGATTVLGQLLNQWTTLNASQIAVVCAESDRGIVAELDRLHFPPGYRIINLDPERGMFSSIQCAAKWDGWRPDLTHFALALGDQPHLRPETLEKLLRFAHRHPDRISQPARNGHARHPVLLPQRIFKELAGSIHSTLKEFLAEHSVCVKHLEIKDPGLDLDIDRPEDYEKALRFAFG